MSFSRVVERLEEGSEAGGGATSEAGGGVMSEDGLGL